MLYCALFYFASEVLFFLQIEGKTIHQQKDFNLLYCDAYCGGLYPKQQYL